MVPSESLLAGAIEGHRRARSHCLIRAGVGDGCDVGSVPPLLLLLPLPPPPPLHATSSRAAMPASVRPGVEWRIPSYTGAQRARGSRKTSQYGVRAPRSARNVRVVTSFDTAGAGILNFQDFPQEPRQTCTIRLATGNEGKTWWRLIFLSVIAAVFVAVVALEGGDPSLERRPKGPADLDRERQLAGQDRRRVSWSSASARCCVTRRSTSTCLRIQARASASARVPRWVSLHS